MSNFLSNLLKTLEPNFKPRWDRYNSELVGIITNKTKWVDVGCGQNEWVVEYGSLALEAIGTDVVSPNNDSTFVLTKANKLPFEDNSIDLISLRFVVEHLQTINEDLNEFARVLKPNGKILILTTNVLNPFIFIAKYIPEKYKTPFLSKVFKVSDNDLFPTTHPLNRPSDFLNLGKHIKLRKIEYISDLNTNNPLMFLAFYLWHLITKPKFLNKFRTNLLVILDRLETKVE
ncbi:class I SAM-dependent methyltransferase [Candidatus Kapabacteria bacterium]|nr:class I SAM-dependent methyltransferase [Candidatus Kapabacteria bacterium]